MFSFTFIDIISFLDKLKEANLLSAVGQNAITLMRKSEEAQQLEINLSREEVLSDHVRMELQTVQQSEQNRISESEERLFVESIFIFLFTHPSLLLFVGEYFLRNMNY